MNLSSKPDDFPFIAGTAASKPIGLFDSGLGGLTVMREINALLPHEQLIYFGDTARIPYGNKSPEAVIRYAIENAIILLDKGIKLLVIACNTATVLALDKLSALFKIPIVGVISPGAEKAVAVSTNGRIAILGTRGTIQSGTYQLEIFKRRPEATLFPVACPLFVPLVEEQWVDSPAAKLIVHEYLHCLKDSEIDTALLGCTHYPLLRELIQEKLGPGVRLVDPASTCAEHVKKVLEERQLLSTEQLGASQYYVSDDPMKFQHLAQNLFGLSIDTVHKIVCP